MRDEVKQQITVTIMKDWDMKDCTVTADTFAEAIRIVLDLNPGWRYVSAEKMY